MNNEYYKELKKHVDAMEAYRDGADGNMSVMKELRNLQMLHTDDEIKPLNCATCQKYVMLKSLKNYEAMKEEYKRKFRRKVGSE